MAKWLVVDPICLNRFGHNYNHLLQVAEWISARDGARVVDLVPSELMVEDSAFSNGTQFGVPLVYPEIFPQQVPSVRPPLSPDAKLALMADFWVALIEANHGMGTLHVVMPGVDFWSVVGLASASRRIRSTTTVTVHLRFLGILDFHSGQPNAELRISAAISEMQASGWSVSLSAEAPTLATWLAGRFGQSVGCTPSLSTIRARIVPAGIVPDDYVYLPGTARLDKGTAVAGAIIHVFRDLFSHAPIEFLAHRARPSRDTHLHEAERRLFAMPGVHMLPAWIPDADMAQVLGSAGAVLLPYDRSTYRLRSSASLGDAIAARVPVVTFGGTGLSTLVDMYGLGMTVANEEEAAEALLEVSQNASAWRHRVMSGSSRFERDAHAAWEDWLEVE
ncbi:MAG: hypothetical protein ACYC3W_08430 [Candidatus Nanopelagicales bacterium]